jgi:Phage integrase family
MKREAPPQTDSRVSLQDVRDRLNASTALSNGRRRDLRSAVTTLAKLTGKPLAMLPLDLDFIRTTLDGMVPAQALVSHRRWVNLRSDLAAALNASGLQPMLKTAGVEFAESWKEIFRGVSDLRVLRGLTRFARWASLRQIAPQSVDDSVIDRFVAELRAATLVRMITQQPRALTKAWNRLVRLKPEQKLNTVTVPAAPRPLKRIRWDTLPAAFRADVDKYLLWCTVPDPLDDKTRSRALAPRTRDLHRDHIQSAVTAAVAAGVDVDRWGSLADIVDPEVFKRLLRQRWQEDGRELKSYTHGVAGTLIAIATEWVGAKVDQIVTLKMLRRKLGPLPVGLTDKNEAAMQQFEDPRLLEELACLPDKLWSQGLRDLATLRRAFLILRDAIAIDLFLYCPARMQNISNLNYKLHLSWPQGRGKPALLRFDSDETKTEVVITFDVPSELGDRLLVYREEIAPKVIGKRPDAVFVTLTGKQVTQAALSTAIVKAVRKHLGIRITPHQFRHLAAKIKLDADPDSLESVSDLLGHRNRKTTRNFYGGINTRRAGWAQAELVRKLKKSGEGRRRRLRLDWRNDMPDAES